MTKADNKMSKKEKREAEAKKEKNKSKIVTAVAVLIILAVVGLAGFLIAKKALFTVKSISDYSAGLTDEGYIEGVKALDYVTLPDLDNMSVNYSDLAPTDEEVQSHIDSLLTAYPVYNQEAGAKVKMGDRVNVDYTGYMDGEAFSGGSTGGMGEEILLGQQGYIDDFEEQISKHTVGENFDIEVTFPDDYGATDLAGKDATFNITINGVYEKAKFDDAFVETNLSDKALTADAYIKKYIEDQYELALEKYVQDYVKNNAVVNSYPENYVKILMGITKATDEGNYVAANNYNQSSYGVDMYSSFNEYTGMDDKEYMANLRVQAEGMADNALLIQAVMEEKGLSVSTADVNELIESYGVDSTYYNTLVNTYGKGYLYQSAMSYTVTNYLKENITVVK
jgi:trigger factor